MSDVCTGVFVKGRVVPEDVVALSVFAFAFFGWFVLQKKGNATFDVKMGSYDGAETCELVGSFLLSQLQDFTETMD